MGGGKAIERLQMASQLSLTTYGKPLTVCYSGGKDSQVLVNLALKAGIPFRVMHNITTVDAPETIRTVRETFSMLESLGIETEMSHPNTTMWRLIVQHRTPPTRLMRYCCKELKERSAVGSFIATGVRSAESRKRKSRESFDVLADKASGREHYGDEVFLSNDNTEARRIIERCTPKNAMCVNPIIDWSDADVLNWYWSECEVHNPLYKDGFYRVGCVGCPQGGTRQQNHEFARYPKFKAGYVRAFGKMLDARRERGLRIFDGWTDGQGVFDWWVGNGKIPGQLEIDWGEP